MNFNKILRYIQHVIYFNICSLSIYLKIYRFRVSN